VKNVFVRLIDRYNDNVFSCLYIACLLTFPAKSQASFTHNFVIVENNNIAICEALLTWLSVQTTMSEDIYVPHLSFALCCCRSHDVPSRADSSARR
jgi:hypothetical protein